MINYAAKTRKAYLINNFDKILNSLNTLHSTVETMTLFVNDQALTLPDDLNIRIELNFPTFESDVIPASIIYHFDF